MMGENRFGAEKGFIPLVPKRSEEGLGFGRSLGEEVVVEGWLAGDTADTDAARGAINPTKGVAPVLNALKRGSRFCGKPLRGELK